MILLNKSKISVGITAFNEVANIQNLLGKIIAQKQDNFILTEIIVISDGSTDKTAAKITDLNSKLIKLFSEKVRLGQSARQNQIIEKMSEDSEALMIFEADSLPATDYFISRLVAEIPDNGNYSYIVGVEKMIAGNTYFEKLINYVFNFKNEIFDNAISGINLYNATGARLFSKLFIKKFRWDPDFQEDSYCYRKARESGLPLYQAKNAVIFYKTVSNFRDYLNQSGKFIKAKKKEKSAGNQTYNLNLNYKKFFQISLKYFLRNPVFFLNYSVLILLSRINSLMLPEYHAYWNQYKSTKKLNSSDHE